MYAVVYKNRVIVGPMEWNKVIFEGSLEKEGLKIVLPKKGPNELPYIVNEDCKICNVQENRSEINLLTHYYYGPLWDTSGDVAIANFEVHESPLESIKMNYKVLTASERWLKEISGIKLNIQNIDVFIETKRETRNVFLQQYNLMKDEDILTWKFNEKWINLTKSDVEYIVQSINNHIQQCFNWEKQISDDIDSKTSIEEIVAIEIVSKQENNEKNFKRNF